MEEAQAGEVCCEISGQVVDEMERHAQVRFLELSDPTWVRLHGSPGMPQQA